ncbi:HAD domain-containing protein [Aromatoleum toluclasticum]|uniref:HAD domain-containing protein n=1 Tax=Aromatoleum toluclasticum TaxID=92003 RepID=UPI0003691A55|nr:HAD domain-containing protein [Aromatoleum toluclasticum]
MTQSSYIFMDFDGVTHPWGEVEDFRCLPQIEAVVRDYAEARIVITADSRAHFTLADLVARFAEDVRPRVSGVTPHLVPRSGAELHGLREREAMLWLAQHVTDTSSASWCALDDAPGNWLTRSRLILTDFKRGFGDEDAAALRRMLDSFRSGTAQPLKSREPSFLRRA